MSETAHVAITTVYSTLIIVDLVGNSLVCAIIERRRDMRIPINYLLLNLAVADMMVATFFAPMHIFIHTFTHPEGFTGAVLCKLLTGGTFAWIGAASSVFTLIAISVKRYYVVTYPYGNKGKLTNRKLKVIIAASWIFALIINIPQFLTLEFDKNMSICIMAWSEEWMWKAFSMLAFLVSGLLPMLLMVALYSKVVKTLWFKRNENDELSYRQKRVIKMRKRVTSMVVIVSIIFSICWFTDTVMFLLSNYSTTNSPSDTIWDIGFISVLFSSATNPFVYALISQRFREKIKRMLCCTGLRSKIEIRPTNGAPNLQPARSISQWIQLATRVHARSSEEKIKRILCSTGLCSTNEAPNFQLTSSITQWIQLANRVHSSGEEQGIEATTNIHQNHTAEPFSKG